MDYQSLVFYEENEHYGSQVSLQAEVEALEGDSKTMTRSTIFKVIMAVSVIVSICVSGCAFNNLRKENKIFCDSTILVGIVSSAKDFGGVPIVVAAYTKNDHQRRVAHYTVLHEPGPYELLVPEGDYFLFAFGDENRNLEYDGNEWAGQYGRSKILSVAAGGVVGDLDIIISDKKNQKVDFPVGASVSDSKPEELHFTSPGVITHLEEPVFSDDFVNQGYWAPLSFFKKMGGNIYFLEEYDPKKVPILFIHGACGSPREWQAIVAKMDRERFQPWFYYYPSGASIEAMSHLLFWKVLNLQRKFRFNTMHIAAHSMGGLVARSFLVNFAEPLSLKTKFISISTPWGGDSLAEVGVKYSPGVIPAWKEMRSNSEFIKFIYDKKLPQTVEHYLFFSYRGNNNPFRPNNDTVVTLQSELDLRSQAEAKMVFGLNEDHGSILSSEKLIDEFNAILHTESQSHGIAKSGNGRMIRVRFSYDYPDDLPKPQPVLILRSLDDKQETMINLRHDSNGSEVGPIPPGQYSVSLVAHAFTPAPLRTTVTIDENSRPEAAFSLKPQGVLIAGINQANKPDNQAGLIRRPDINVKVNSIKIRGNNINRSLTPIEGYFDFLDHYLSQKDFSYNGYLYFFDLPEGEYTLTVSAEGYREFSGAYRIIPGQNYNVKNIELQSNL